MVAHAHGLAASVVADSFLGRQSPSWLLKPASKQQPGPDPAGFSVAGVGGLDAQGRMCCRHVEAVMVQA